MSTSDFKSVGIIGAGHIGRTVAGIALRAGRTPTAGGITAPAVATDLPGSADY
jgi:phosphoglycerate dehydrogenase-like enzyme